MKLPVMTIRRFAFVALALFGSLASRVQAEGSSEDSAAIGRKFAERVCGACHVVTQLRDEVPILMPPAPSFAVLAQRPALTEQALREFLGSNHRGLGPAERMPNPRLVDYQVDEIVAYFMALKAAK